MTTPNQPVPVGLGAFEIDDGGGPYQYGQDMTESIARSVFLPGFDITDIGSIFDALDALRTLLLKLPLEALHAIQKALPDLGGLSPFPDVSSGVEGIIGALLPKETIEDIKKLIDAIFKALLGGTPDLFGTDLFDAVTTALQNIPGINVLGFGGPANTNSTFQSVLDQYVGGAVGDPGFGATFSDMFNVSYVISSWAQLGNQAFNIAGIRSNKSLNTGFFPTSESNITLDKVALSSSAPTFPLTQSTAITSFQRISQSGTKGLVSWMGSGVTNITHAFVNIFKMDTSTGDLALVHNSGNLVGSLSGTMQHNVYELGTPLDVEPGEVYGIEIAVRGAGTHSIVGQSTWLPDHPNVYPRRLSASRNSGTGSPPPTISTGSVTYAANVPFVEFGVSAGDVAIPHTSETTLFNTAGSFTLPIPDWANSARIITVGGGGGGHQGGTWGVNGKGGDEGSWTTGVWIRGTDFTGTPSIGVTIPAAALGGAKPGSAGGSGANGGNVVVTLGAHTFTATGGAGATGVGAAGSDAEGDSPGNQTYDGVTYVGGGTANTFGGDGPTPGSGGAGGNYVSFQPGGNGGLGSCWIKFSQ